MRYPAEENAVVVETLSPVALITCKMYCYICVTYLMIICSAQPPKYLETRKVIEKRSLFHDVIESLRIRAQLPEITNSNEDNNLGQISDRFGYENDLLQLPNDAEFVPRRNDRIEMPSLKYRIPKSLEDDENKDDFKEEIVVYVNTPNDEVTQVPTTQKPKKPKRPIQNNKDTNKNKDNEANKPEVGSEKPFSNSMMGQSQIGNRESQTVVKPTVIVNFRGSIQHRESDIRLERRNNDNETKEILPQNIFNINQEIKLDKSDAWMGSNGGVQKQPVRNKPSANLGDQPQPRIDEDMMMCETGWKSKDGRRKHDILQIFLNV